MNKHNAVSTSSWISKAGLVMACLFFIVVVMINLLPFVDDRDDLMDFGSFYASGLKARNGENPYDANSEYIFEIDFSRVGAGGKMMNLNPPISVPIFEYLSLFEPHRTLILWQMAAAALYAGVIVLLAFFYRQNMTPIKFMWAFALAGFWHSLVLGQIYILLLVFTVLGWIFLERGKFVLAGIAIGIVIALKPNFLVWSLFLIVGGYYAAALISVITSLIISLLPVFIYGMDIYAQWLDASALSIRTLTMPGNNSILGLTARFQSITLGLAISAIFILALLILARRKVPEDMTQAEYISGLGIIASLLASPISWTGYTILLLPVFFSLKKWTLPVTISAVLLAIPFQIVLQFFQTSFVSYVIFGWFYGWAILSLLGSVVKKAMMTSSIQTS